MNLVYQEMQRTRHKRVPGRKEGGRIVYSINREEGKKKKKKKKKDERKTGAWRGESSWCVTCRRLVARMFCLGRSAFSTVGGNLEIREGEYYWIGTAKPVQIKTIVVIELSTIISNLCVLGKGRSIRVFNLFYQDTEYGA